MSYHIRKIMPSAHRYAYFVIVSIALLLAGCGQPDAPTAVSAGAVAPQPVQQTNPTLPPTATLTGEQINARIQAEDAQLAQDVATVQAMPTDTPGPLPPLPTDFPSETINGMSWDCLGVLDKMVDSTNCWRGDYYNEHFGVWGGAYAGESMDGLIMVISRTLDTDVGGDPMIYETPTKAGMTSIVTVTLPYVTVNTDNGTTFIFNLTTRAWETPLDIPPTATLTGPQINARVQAEDAQLAQMLATARAMPTSTPGPLPPLPTDWPLDTITGFSLECVGVLSIALLPRNCWYGTYQNDDVALFSGVAKQDATIGLLVIIKSTINNGQPMLYETPIKAGGISITAVTLPYVTLTAENGTTFIFNIDTQQWETPPATLTTPTAEPTTPVAPSS